MAIKIEQTIRAFQKQGGYNAIKSSKELADTLNSLLMQVSNDRYLRILFSHDPVPPKEDKEGPLPDFIK